MISHFGKKLISEYFPQAPLLIHRNNPAMVVMATAKALSPTAMNCAVLTDYSSLMTAFVSVASAKILALNMIARLTANAQLTSRTKVERLSLYQFVANSRSLVSAQDSSRQRPAKLNVTMTPIAAENTNVALQDAPIFALDQWTNESDRPNLIVIIQKPQLQDLKTYPKRI